MRKKLSPQRRPSRRRGGRRGRREKKPVKGKPGPETLCTPKLVRSLSAKILRGRSIEAACGAVGIDAKSLRDWEEKADAGTEPYASILPTLKRALAEAKGVAEERVYAGEGGWQSSARWLESIKPEIWRRTERRELEGGAKPINVNVNLASEMLAQGKELLGKVLAAALKPGVPGVPA